MSKSIQHAMPHKNWQGTSSNSLNEGDEFFVPFLDLLAAYKELKSEIDSAVARLLDSGWYILGEEVEAFEVEWASYCGARNAVGVGNGLDAITLALKAVGIGPGDEVIVPSNTYIATWLAVSTVGATIVPVEPDEQTHNIDVNKIESKITSKTRAILPVHLYGQPADIDPLLAIAKNNGLVVIEDAAQAHGARYKGRRIGTHGQIICWSFYPGKNLGAMGDAGAITTSDDDLAESIRLLRNYGSKKKYVNVVQGVNSRMDPLQAAILRVKLGHLDEWNARRAAIAKIYLKELAEINGLNLPVVPEWADPVWHLFVVRHSMRDAFQKALAKAGVQTQIHYPIAPFQQEAYRSESYAEVNYPIATKYADQVLSLPIGPQLSEATALNVARIVRKEMLK